MTTISTGGILRQIVKADGIPGLWRGVLYPFLGFGAIFSVAFGTNYVCEDLMKQYKQSAKLN